MNNKLFLVEGLPCSGKSTTGKFIAELLTKKGMEAKYYDEGSLTHPAEYTFHAYVTDDEAAEMEDELREKMINISERFNDGYIVFMDAFDGFDFAHFIMNKIYDMLPWEIEYPVMLHKWEQFSGSVKDNEAFVFDAVFLQNPMCETMMRFNMSEEESLEYINKIVETVKKLEPVVIYLKNDDIIETVNKTAPERDGWLETVIRYHSESGYGQSVGAEGFDGYIGCLQERQRRELDIVEKLPVKKLVLDNAHRDWNKAYEQLSSFIDEL